MNESALEQRWPRKRWWLVIGLMLCCQAGLIFWLGENSFPQPRLPARAPLLRIAGPASGPIVALTDPTLFALPHSQSFSGDAWLNATSPPALALSLDWPDKPSWLPLSTESLGELFSRFAETNFFESRRSVKSDTTLTMPRLPPRIQSEQESRAIVTGELARRRLVTPFDLHAWPHTDTLTNTVVRVLVDSGGQTISADLMSGSGLAAADQYALAQAAGARFESFEQEGPDRNHSSVQGLTWGDLVFEWRTLPLPLTNAPNR